MAKQIAMVIEILTLAMLFAVFTRGRASMLAWILFLSIDFGWVFAKAALPERVTGPVILLELILALGLFACFILVQTRLSIRLRRIRNELRAQAGQAGRLEALDGAAPQMLVDASAPFERLGFRLLDMGRPPSQALMSLLWREEGSVIAEVVWFPNPRGSCPSFVLELTSVLQDRRGVLCTSTSGIGFDCWQQQLAQVFPGASAEHLVVRHEEALAFLEAHGLRTEPIQSDQILSLRSWGMSSSLRAAASTPAFKLYQAALAVARCEHRNLGPIRENREALTRLARMSGAPAGSWALFR